MVDLKSLPPDLQERYGYRKRSKVGLAVTALIAVIVTVGLGWFGWRVANPPVRWKLLTWSAPAPDHTRVTWEVRRRAGDSVTCVIRVQDALMHDVGYATVTLPPGDAYVQPTYNIGTRTAGRAVELLACAANAVPRVGGPEFPPGTVNPPQPWTPPATPSAAASPSTTAATAAPASPLPATAASPTA